MCSERPPDRCLLLISSQTKGRGKYRKICPTEVFREPRKLELATTGAEPGLHHGDLLLIGNHLWISGKSCVGFIVSGRYLTMESKFFRHNKCCLHWIESPRTARIVRGWTRRATNQGRTARAVAPTNAERLAAPPSQL